MKAFYKKYYLKDYNLDEHSCMVILPLYRVKVESLLKINEWTVNSKPDNFFKGCSFVLNWCHVT